MTTRTIPNPGIGRSAPGAGRQVWTFVRHFLEMCVAMCLGGGALNALVFLVGPAVLGYPDLRETSPTVALLIISVLYTAPMAAWMRVRGMAWRPILEMSAATIGLAAVLVILAAFGVLTSAQLHRWALGFCGPACLVMLAAMLLRPGTYSGHMGEHAAGRARATAT